MCKETFCFISVFMSVSFIEVRRRKYLRMCRVQTVSGDRQTFCPVRKGVLSQEKSDLNATSGTAMSYCTYRSSS
jgi:hypothetical protein